MQSTYNDAEQTRKFDPYNRSSLYLDYKLIVSGLETLETDRYKRHIVIFGIVISGLHLTPLR